MSWDFIERCKEADFSAICLTVDTLVAGNREKDLYTGMVIPPKFTLNSLFSFATHPGWSLNYLMRKKFELANVAGNITEGTGKLTSVVGYMNSQFDRSITWRDAEEAIKRWCRPFAIKGVMSVEDAKGSGYLPASHDFQSWWPAIGWLNGTFDQLGPIVDAVGDQIEVIVDGGVQRHAIRARHGSSLHDRARISICRRGGGYAGVDRALASARGN